MRGKANPIPDLGLDETPWTTRLLDQRLKSKKADTEARAKAGSDRVPNTKPSHALDDFVGDYEHPAYGTLRISRAGEGLQFEFHKFKMPLAHFHYDRFDTPNDERFGSFSVNFRTNPQGDIDTAVISLDEAEAAFIRKPDRLGPEMLAKLAGTYALPTGQTFQVVLKEGALSAVLPGQKVDLIPYKGLKFRIKEFSDRVFEFVVENGQVKSLKQITPNGEIVLPRR